MNREVGVGFGPVAGVHLCAATQPAEYSGGKSAAGPPPTGRLSVFAPQWAPSDYLNTLAARFTGETGIAVEIHQIPWENFQREVLDLWASRSDADDLIMGDSQWLGMAATGKHYVDISDWSRTNIPWPQIMPGAKQAYCEYEGRIYGVPCEADASGFAYRKDLFEDAKEKAAFRARYGYELAPPQTWEQLRDIAEFFNRPDQNLYGMAPLYGGGYDDITMGVQQVLWAFGGDLDHLNTPVAVEALDFYAVQLKPFTPPGGEDYTLTDTPPVFCTGRVAMALSWYSLFGPLCDPSRNPLADKTGFFITPAGRGGHFISIGGQGMSISSYSKNQENAKKFLAWFSTEATQREWARLGGLTSNTAVLQSADFLNATPFNAAFAASLPFVRDFYRTPNYAALLASTQRHWHAVVVGAETAQAAMDAVAREHAQIQAGA